MSNSIESKAVSCPFCGSSRARIVREPGEAGSGVVLMYVECLVCNARGGIAIGDAGCDSAELNDAAMDDAVRRWNERVVGDLALRVAVRIVGTEVIGAARALRKQLGRLSAVHCIDCYPEEGEELDCNVCVIADVDKVLKDTKWIEEEAE